MALITNVNTLHYLTREEESGVVDAPTVNEFEEYFAELNQKGGLSPSSHGSSISYGSVESWEQRFFTPILDGSLHSIPLEDVSKDVSYPTTRRKSRWSFLWHLMTFGCA